LRQFDGTFHNKDPFQDKIFTMIDPVTGWLWLSNPLPSWLVSFPFPRCDVFDNGGEFKREFKMCGNYGIKAKPRTNHSPQVKANILPVHKVVNDMLK
jgi:hypothetical protein